jgi:hypothetical protein
MLQFTGLESHPGTVGEHLFVCRGQRLARRRQVRGRAPAAAISLPSGSAGGTPYLIPG